MNGIEYATNSAPFSPRRPDAVFWLVNSAVWAAYAGALMLPWIGRYPVVDMLPNKAAIAGAGIGITAGLRAFYRWTDSQRISPARYVALAFAACVVGAVVLDLTVIALTQGPDAIPARWEGGFTSIVGGVPMPGRVGQFAILLVAWSLGLNLFGRLRPAVAAPLVADVATDQSLDATLGAAGTTIRARDGHRTILLDRDEIDWIAADGDYIRMHSGAKSLLIRATMKRSADILSPLGFVRVHRSAIVNPRRVREIVREGNECSVLLRNGVRVRVGRNYASQVAALLDLASSGMDEPAS